jgi:hypothetical protein
MNPLFCSTVSNCSVMFHAGELGEQRDRKFLIGENQLGLYCIAGVEPSPVDDGGIMGKVNQDRCIVANPLYPDASVDWFALGVFDGLGHGNSSLEFCCNLRALF